MIDRAHDLPLTKQAAALNIPLMLSGHTHGGHIALPGGVPILVPGPASRRFAHGRYDLGPIRLRPVLVRPGARPKPPPRKMTAAGMNHHETPSHEAVTWKPGLEIPLRCGRDVEVCGPRNPRFGGGQ